MNLLLYNNNNINESKKTILKNNFIENNNSNFANEIDKSICLNSDNLKREIKDIKKYENSPNINYNNTCRKVINQNNKNLYFNNTHLNRKNQKKMNYYINLICCFKNDNNPVQLIIKFKKKIISEEEIFVSHFLLKSLQSVCFEKKYEYRTKKYCTNDFNNIKYKNTMNNINIKKKSIIYNSQNENSKEFNNKNEKKF